MKKTTIAILLISLGASTTFAQRKDDRRDDRRYEQAAPRPTPQSVQAAPRPTPQPVVIQHKPAPQPVVIHKPDHRKPEPVKFVVKKPKPRHNPLNTLIRVLAPKPSRAVVIVNASEPVFEMSQLDRQPAMLEAPEIEYPENMASAGRSGEVSMLVQIDKDGYVGLEKVISATNSSFEQAAVNSLSSIRYEAPRRDGRRVNTRFTMTIPFEISD